MITTQPLSHPEDITPAEQVSSLWEQVSEDEMSEQKERFFSDYECELLGVEVATWIDDCKSLLSIIEKHEDQLGEDWPLECATVPYKVKYAEAKDELWQAVLDYVDSQLLGA